MKPASATPTVITVLMIQTVSGLISSLESVPCKDDYPAAATSTTAVVHRGSGTGSWCSRKLSM